MRKAAILLFAILIPVAASRAGRPAPGSERYAVAREGPFEFASKPAVTRAGDTVTISFETRSFCDVAVAIEGADGRIVRHLAAGVLGPNAPEPFAKNAKRQTVVWDGKDDRGVYVDDKDSATVRVSLGLKPQFERTLHWHPQRRNGWRGRSPLIVPQPEGVYVYEGDGVEQIRLYDRAGAYVRTVYPFPSDRVDEVRGLYRHAFPQDGKTLPLKANFLQTTMLTSGTSWQRATYNAEEQRKEDYV